MELIRITQPRDPRLVESMAQYARSFPAHEQRSARAQAVAFSDADYEYKLICVDGLPVGALLCWACERFIYVEHFYIYENHRGAGLGAEALELLARRGKRLILEIDPPVDAPSVRRENFYLRCGFAENPFAHVHPPYHSGSAGHALVVMSRPGALSPAEYADFNDYLAQRVMAGACDGAAMRAQERPS